MAVTAGSVAFVAYSYDSFNSGMGNQQGFAFIALGPIGANEQIRFVDGAMNNKGSLTIDSQVVWTNNTGASLPAGTIVQVTFDRYSGADSSDAAGFTTSAVNIGSVTAPTALWNVDTTDNLYAVTGLSGAASGTTVAAILWGDTGDRGITAAPVSSTPRATREPPTTPR
jgi:hypothetical protein